MFVAIVTGGIYCSLSIRLTPPDSTHKVNSVLQVNASSRLGLSAIRLTRLAYQVYYRKPDLMSHGKGQQTLASRVEMDEDVIHWCLPCVCSDEKHMHTAVSDLQ